MAARAWAGRIGTIEDQIIVKVLLLGDRPARSDILEQLCLVETILNLLVRLDALN